MSFHVSLFRDQSRRLGVFSQILAAALYSTVQYSVADESIVMASLSEFGNQGHSHTRGPS